MAGNKRSIPAILLVLSMILIAGCMEQSAEKTVKTGDIVTMDYIGWFDDSTIFGTSNATIAHEAGIYQEDTYYEPVLFAAGSGEVIDGFDIAVIGMKANESKNITLTPDQAYGSYDPLLIRPVPMSTFIEANITPYADQTLYYEMQPVRVDRIEDNETVYVDFNHPMAGKTLHFMLTVLEIKTA